jgi:integrase
MLSVKIILDERSEKKDGTCPLKIRVIINRSSFHISLGHSIPAKEWDDVNQRIKSNSKTVSSTTRFNASLNGRKQEVYEVLLKLQDEGLLDDLSIDRIKSYLTKNSAETFALEFGEEIIEELVQGRKIGNARVYRTMLSSLRTFLNEKDIPLRQINYSFVKKYEAWYLGKGNAINGLSVHLRTLRALINRAIKERRLPKDHNPFSDYKIAHQKTRKRAIKPDALQALKDYHPVTERQKRAKQYFFFSFLTIGSSFVDIALLKLSNIIEGRIQYKRRKTGRLHSIPVTPALQQIIDVVARDKKPDDYIFNIVRSEDPARQAVQIRDELRRYNKTLKDIGEACGIEIPLSSYVSRHTYATVARNRGIPVAAISEALGHTDVKTTAIYLDEFEQKDMDEFHKMVIE